MAGTLVITEEIFWGPANWVFDSTIEYVASHVGASDQPLAERLLRGRVYAGDGYIDLRSCAEQQLESVREGVMLYLTELELEGPGTWEEPEFYEGHRDRVKELWAMLVAALAIRRKCVIPDEVLRLIPAYCRPSNGGSE